MRRPIRGLCVVLLACAPAAGADDFFDRIRINGYTSFEFEKQLEAKGKGNGDLFSTQLKSIFCSSPLARALAISWLSFFGKGKFLAKSVRSAI